ncbi:MAG: ABC transporter permease subunit [Pirellulaceae bacterium]|jgi:iron(III) transport system permease protein|nr:ABC transporter permease subunit [Pirellulaceae bacterium]
MVRPARWCFWGGWLLLAAGVAGLLGTADRRVWLLAGNTGLVAVGTCVVSVPLGTLLALLLCRTDLPGRRCLAYLTLALLFLPVLVHAAAWEAALGKLGWYMGAGATLPRPPLRGWGAVAWIHGLWAAPWVTGLVAAALAGQARELEEAALLEAGPWTVVREITLRQARPGIRAACVWVLLSSATEIVVTDLYQVRTLAEEIYMGLALSDDPAATFGLRTALLATLVLAGAALVLLDSLPDIGRIVPQGDPFRFRLGRWRWVVGACTALGILLLVAVPLVSLIYQAGLVVRDADGHVVRIWSLARCAELLVPGPATYRVSVLWSFRRMWWWTFWMGASAASLVVIAAAPLAWWGRRGGLRAVPAIGCAAVGLATMGPLVGVLLIKLFTLRDDAWLIGLYDRTILAPVLAAAWRGLPVGIFVCWAAMSAAHPLLSDAARVDGARVWQRFWHLGLRLHGPVLAVAWLAALALACGELSATILVIPPGLTTLTLRVFGLLHAGVANQAAALCLTALAAVLLLAALVSRLLLRVRTRLAGSAGHVESWRHGRALP